MAKQKVQSFINLETLAGGAFAEKLTEALAQVAENIQNPNTEATTKRQINVTLKFAPNKTRQLVSTQIAVTTKLAATEAIDTQMIMGVNMRTGQIEIAEYDGQIRGQMSFSDLTQQEEKAEPEAGQTKPANAQEVQQAAVEQTQATPTGKPLDLKNRNKLVPGKDFDPVTGEIFVKKEPEDDQQTTAGQPEDDHKIVTIGQRAANV